MRVLGLVLLFRWTGFGLDCWYNRDDTESGELDVPLCVEEALVDLKALSALCKIPREALREVVQPSAFSVAEAMAWVDIEPS